MHMSAGGIIIHISINHYGLFMGPPRRSAYKCQLACFSNTVNVNQAILSQMTKLSIFLLAFGVVAAAHASELITRDTSTAVIDLGYAQYQGVFDTSRNLSYFLGIRYANPPTGTS